SERKENTSSSKVFRYFLLNCGVQSSIIISPKMKLNQMHWKLLNYSRKEITKKQRCSSREIPGLERLTFPWVHIRNLGVKENLHYSLICHHCLRAFGTHTAVTAI